jgi:hypothetical protein
VGCNDGLDGSPAMNCQSNGEKLVDRFLLGIQSIAYEPILLGLAA